MSLQLSRACESLITETHTQNTHDTKTKKKRCDGNKYDFYFLFFSVCVCESNHHKKRENTKKRYHHVITCLSVVPVTFWRRRENLFRTQQPLKREREKRTSVGNSTQEEVRSRPWTSSSWPIISDGKFGTPS